VDLRTSLDDVDRRKLFPLPELENFDSSAV
jgi:hypothetical protein